MYTYIYIYIYAYEGTYVSHILHYAITPLRPNNRFWYRLSIFAMEVDLCCILMCYCCTVLLSLHYWNDMFGSVAILLRYLYKYWGWHDQKSSQQKTPIGNINKEYQYMNLHILYTHVYIYAVYNDYYWLVHPIGINIYSLSALPYSLSAGPDPVPAPRCVRGPRSRPSEGPGAVRRGPRREGPAHEARPAPGLAPPIGNRE